VLRVRASEVKKHGTINAGLEAPAKEEKSAM